jgi:hypothetical protein
MNTPQLASDYDTPSDFTSLGSFSIDELERMAGNEVSGLGAMNDPQPTYHIIVKRNDGLYKTLHIMNTLFSILAVLMIVATFVMVFYSLVTITEVAEIVNQVKEHNTLDVVPTPVPTP